MKQASTTAVSRGGARLVAFLPRVVIFAVVTVVTIIQERLVVTEI